MKVVEAPCREIMKIKKLIINKQITVVEAEAPQEEKEEEVAMHNQTRTNICVTTVRGMAIPAMKATVDLKQSYRAKQLHYKRRAKDPIHSIADIHKKRIYQGNIWHLDT